MPLKDLEVRQDLSDVHVEIQSAASCQVKHTRIIAAYIQILYASVYHSQGFGARMSGIEWPAMCSCVAHSRKSSKTEGTLLCSLTLTWHALLAGVQGGRFSVAPRSECEWERADTAAKAACRPAGVRDLSLSLSLYQQNSCCPRFVRIPWGGHRPKCSQCLEQVLHSCVAEWHLISMSTEKLMRRSQTPVSLGSSVVN
jgi:hypothetical protein